MTSSLGNSSRSLDIRPAILDSKSLSQSSTSLGKTFKSIKNKKSDTYDIKAISTKSSEFKPYEGDGLSCESVNVKRETEKKHMVHWQACPNYKTLYGEGGELNLEDNKPPVSGISEDGSSISHGGISYQRTGSGKYRSSSGALVPGSAMGAIFSSEESLKFGGVNFQRTESGRFINKNGQELSNDAMAAMMQGYANNGTLTGFDNFNLDGSQRPDYSNEAFGRFAAIDSIVAEGRFRMMAMAKKDGEEPPAPPPLKPKYNPTFDSSRIGSHTQMPTGEAGKAEYKTEYNRSFSGDERMTSADRMKNGEIYQVVCDNLKQNLQMLENYKKDPEGTLREQFQSFASFGKDRHKDGSHITLSQIDRWFKQAEILDGDTVTTTDTAIIFKKVSGSCPWLTFREFQKFLEMFAEDHNLDFNEVKKKLAICGSPMTNNTTEPDNEPVINRLTDVSQYPGTHKHQQPVAVM